MICVQLDTLNPKVRKIVETALKEARPFWFAITFNQCQVWPRKEVYMLRYGERTYRNANAVSWLHEKTRSVDVDGCLLALTRTSKPFKYGTLKVNSTMRIGDMLMCAEGRILFEGKLPDETLKLD